MVTMYGMKVAFENKMPFAAKERWQKKNALEMERYWPKGVEYEKPELAKHLNYGEKMHIKVQGFSV